MEETKEQGGFEPRGLEKDWVFDRRRRVGQDAALGSLHSSYIDEEVARVLVISTDQHRRSSEIDLTDSGGSGQDLILFKRDWLDCFWNGRLVSKYLESCRKNRNDASKHLQNTCFQNQLFPSVNLITDSGAQDTSTSGDLFLRSRDPVENQGNREPRPSERPRDHLLSNQRTSRT